MAIEVVKTRDLVEGMYVAQLDRPWLETPFLFQGFLIKGAPEIEELQRYCDFVYVEAKNTGRRTAKGAGRGTAQGAASARHGKPAKPTWWRRIAFRSDEKQAVPAREPRPGEFYVDTADVKAELPFAKDAYARASTTFGETMDRVRSGGKLDLHTLESVVNPMIESVLRNRDAMTWLSRIKQADDYTYGHSVSCAIYAIAFGRHLGLPREDLEVLGLGALLLDVGKTRLPKELLAKVGKLSSDEMKLMRAHVEHSERIVRDQVGADSRVLSMVRSHHERYNGSGYPDGMKGPDIHVFGRIAGIVDFYDALITPRTYAPAISAFDAMRALNKRANTEFQAEMVEQFIQAVGVFPNGALVELSDGEVGIVLEQNRVRRLRPKIMVILDRDKQRLPEPKVLDLRDHPSEPGEENAIWIDRGLEFRAYGIDPAEYYL
jgi:HD-GYP domain-containing protein (c-di-GMP phosphodiesterase class II)